MTTTCFILGKTPLLSAAEIFQRLETLGFHYSIVELTSQALVINTDASLDASEWQRSLGGCIKVGTITTIFQSLRECTEYASQFDFIKRHLAVGAGKRVFGFSCYGDLLRRSGKEFTAIGLRLKQQARNNGESWRFIVAKDNVLTSVQVDKNKIIKHGADILIVAGLSSIYVGRTLSVQEFEEYSFRDYGRPGRDSRSGMLPPKLAKMMLNLSGSLPSHTILDPFCGSGTILQEALLLGLPNLIGSDISKKATADTTTNLTWLEKNSAVDIHHANIVTADVSSLDSLLEQSSIDRVVTEPYLGPPASRNISVINMLDLIQELETLYLAAFKTLGRLMKSGGRLVFVFPLFKTAHGIFALKILEQLETMGFKRINPFPKDISLYAKIGPTARGALIYSRPDQKVEREIFIFQYQ